MSALDKTFRSDPSALVEQTLQVLRRLGTEVPIILKTLRTLPSLNGIRPEVSVNLSAIQAALLKHGLHVLDEGTITIALILHRLKANVIRLVRSTLPGNNLIDRSTRNLLPTAHRLRTNKTVHVKHARCGLRLRRRRRVNACQVVLNQVDKVIPGNALRTIPKEVRAVLSRPVLVLSDPINALITGLEPGSPTLCSIIDSLSEIPVRVDANLNAIGASVARASSRVPTNNVSGEGYNCFLVVHSLVPTSGPNITVRLQVSMSGGVSTLAGVSRLVEGKKLLGISARGSVLIGSRLCSRCDHLSLQGIGCISSIQPLPRGLKYRK